MSAIQANLNNQERAGQMGSLEHSICEQLVTREAQLNKYKKKHILT